MKHLIYFFQTNHKIVHFLIVFPDHQSCIYCMWHKLFFKDTEGKKQSIPSFNLFGQAAHILQFCR